VRAALTGTPGTGKTTVSELLKKEGYNVLDLKRFVKTNDLGDQKQEFEVDIERTRRRVDKQDFDFVEGHLSHHLSVDVCFVLRTRPDILRDRLEQRQYTKSKIDENVKARS
jgi:Predicted nucleotide kinase (related to CMP and AMP kinases)